jgi:hypothetical protein
MTYYAGVVNTTNLIKEIMKRDAKHDVTLLIANSHAATARQAIDHNSNEAARITYDNKFLNLQAPDPRYCRKYSTHDLENILRDKITERCTLTDNMAKTALKLFGDGGHHSGDLTITRTQINYVFWKRLRINVTQQDMDNFFEQVHIHYTTYSYIPGKHTYIYHTYAYTHIYLTYIPPIHTHYYSSTPLTL